MLFVELLPSHISSNCYYSNDRKIKSLKNTKRSRPYYIVRILSNLYYTINAVFLSKPQSFVNLPTNFLLISKQISTSQLEI